MVLQVATLLLVLGVTFLQSIFGFFSGIINLFCTMVSVIVAFGFYEPLTAYAAKSLELHPGYSEPCCLLLLFVTTLTILRFAADNLIRGNVHVPMAMDWGGASICGFISAQFSVGTLVAGILMLPLGGTVMGFNRYERTAETNASNSVPPPRVNLWLRTDDMTVGFFNLVSGGSMKGSTAFRAVYPDFMDSVYFTTNTVQPESSPAVYRTKKTGDGAQDGLAIDTWWEQKGALANLKYREKVPDEKDKLPAMKAASYKPQADKKLLGMRLVLKKSSADFDRGNPVHMFRPTMIRLVGTVDGRPEQAVPVIIGGADNFIGGANRIVDYDNNFRMTLEPDGANRVDVYFEVDSAFDAAFVEYRRHARAQVTADSFKKEPPKVALKLMTAEEIASASASGRLTFGSTLSGGSTENRNLPFEFSLAKLKNSPDTKLEGELLVHSRVSGTRKQYERGQSEPSIKEMKYPAGYKILQIQYKPKEVRTIVGQVFNYVGGTLNQYFAVDDRGERHELHGYFAMVKRGNDERFEFFFNGSKDDPLDPSFKHMLDFKDIEKAEINDDDSAQIILFFLVKPGTRILRIQNQGGDGGDVSIPISP